MGGFISEEDDRLAHLSLMARGKRQLDLSQYDLAVGIKAIGGDIAIDADQLDDGDEDTEKVGAVGLGFEAGFLVNPLALQPDQLQRRRLLRTEHHQLLGRPSASPRSARGCRSRSSRRRAPTSATGAWASTRASTTTCSSTEARTSV